MRDISEIVGSHIALKPHVEQSVTFTVNQESFDEINDIFNDCEVVTCGTPHPLVITEWEWTLDHETKDHVEMTVTLRGVYQPETEAA